MPLQRRLLQAMLTLLGLAALAGVSTIFLPAPDLIGRTAATLFFAAVALGLAAFSSRRFERQETRTTGALALAAITVGFALTLAAVWAEFLTSWRTQWDLAGTTLLFVPCAGAIVAGHAFLRHPGGRWSGFLLIFAGAGVFVFGAIEIWLPALGRPFPDPHFGVTAGLLANAGFTGALALAGFPVTRRWWTWIGVAAAAIGLLMGLYGTWIQPGGDPTWFGQCQIIALVTGVANVLLLITLPGGYRWLTLGTTACAIATGLAATYVNILTQGFQNSFYGLDDLPARLLAAGCIVTTCGILAIAVVRAFSRRVLITQARSIADLRAVACTCPRCGKRHEAAIGESRCPGCGLLFILRLAEPRCPTCDYCLLDLQADKCPECGTPIGVPAASSPAAAGP